MTEMEEERESTENPWTQSLYGALRSLANKLLEGRGPNCLNPSDIVQEAWLRLRHEQTIKPEDRLGFLRLARKVLRRVLFDHFREQSRIKHGGQVQRITFTNRLAILLRNSSSSGTTSSVLHHTALTDCGSSTIPRYSCRNAYPLRPLSM